MGWISDGTWKNKILNERKYSLRRIWESILVRAQTSGVDAFFHRVNHSAYLFKDTSEIVYYPDWMASEPLSFQAYWFQSFSFSVKVTVGNCLKYTAYKSCPSHKCSTSSYFLFSSQCIAQTKVGQHIWIKYIKISSSCLFLHNTQDPGLTGTKNWACEFPALVPSKPCSSSSVCCSGNYTYHPAIA